MGVIRYHWKQAADYHPGRMRSVESIILHSSDGHCTGDIATLTQPGAPDVSAHWYVTRTGDVWHFVQNADTAYHVGQVFDQRYSNSSSIGIEQEHMDGEEGWPDSQVMSVSRIVAALRQKYGPIPVKSHAEVAAPHGRKVDPMGYPWGDISRYVASAMVEKWTFEQIEGAP